MKTVNKREENKTKVIEWLNTMSEHDQEVLLDRYSQKTKDIYNTFTPQEYLDLKMDILILKYSRDSLVDSYVSTHPVIDHPGCQLGEFLVNEMVNPTMHE